MTDKLKSQLKFIVEIDKMKSIYRQTLLIDKSREETDAEHAWHFAMIAMTLYEHVGIEGVDLDRVIKMALIHDLVEIYAGDTFAYDTKGYEDKELREQEAADLLFSILPEVQRKEYQGIWEEFEAMETPDALYAGAIDRLQPFLNNTMTGGHTWVKHNVAASQVFERMLPIKTALPQLWEVIETGVADGIAKGYLREE